MNKLKILSVLMTVVLLFSVASAGSSFLLSSLTEDTNAQEVDNDLVGVLEGMELNSNLSGMISGILGSETATDVNDDGLSTVTTIVQALLGGTAEGETTLDAIRNKLGDLGGTVTDNQLIQAIVSTLMGFDFSNFDMSMLTSNDFISALTQTLGGLNLGGAQQVTPTQAPSTQTAVVTPSSTLPTLVTQQPSSTVPQQSTSSIFNYPTENVPTTFSSGSVGVIVDNTVNVTPYPGDTQQNVMPATTPSVPVSQQNPQQQAPSATKKVVSGKMIVGVIVLLLSAISVVAVSLVLKKSKP